MLHTYLETLLTLGFSKFDNGMKQLVEVNHFRPKKEKERRVNRYHRKMHLCETEAIKDIENRKTTIFRVFSFLFFLFFSFFFQALERLNFAAQFTSM